MNEQLKVKEIISAEVRRFKQFDDKIQFKGQIRIDHFDKNGQLLGNYLYTNTIVNVGKNAILDIMFGGETQITEWFCGLIQDDNYTGIAAADTIASHAGWEEFTGYSDNRKQWEPEAASSQIITNSTPMEFAITSGKTLKGIFIVSNVTKGGTTGTLWSAGLFTSDLSVNNGDTLRITYTLSM